MGNCGLIRNLWQFFKTFMWALNLSGYFYMYISKMCLITNALSKLPNW